jgi:hypothetical protein
MEPQITIKVTSPLLERIKQRGYWRVVIRPSRFERQRIPDRTMLYPLLRERVVRLRGWDFPQLEANPDYRRGQDWIDQESEWNYYLEYWRFYQSGQFIDFAGVKEDWRDHSELSPLPSNWQPGQLLPITDTVYHFTEIFEFAARLALTDIYAVDDRVHLEVSLHGLKGRQLYADDPKRALLFGLRPASVEEFAQTFEPSRIELIANTHELALQAASQLFDLFHWQPAPGVLQDIQAEFLRR